MNLLLLSKSAASEIRISLNVNSENVKAAFEDYEAEMSKME